MNLNELAPSWRKQNDSQGRLSAERLAGIIRRAEHARTRHWLMGALGFVLALLACLLYTSPSPRDGLLSRMPSSA